MLDPISQSLHKDLAQKLTATDHLMKESISRMVKSKVKLTYSGTDYWLQCNFCKKARCHFLKFFLIFLCLLSYLSYNLNLVEAHLPLFITYGKQNKIDTS